MSRQFGDSPEEIQKLGAAVRKAGGDMETAAKGGFKAFIEAQKAVSGDEGARKHFADLNIPLEKLATLRGPRDTLIAIADAVQHAANQHEALAAAGDLVGTRQASLIQLFRLGGDAMRKAGDDAVVMSNRTVESLVRVEKGLGRVKNTATNIFGNLLVFLHDNIGRTIETSGAVLGTVFNSIRYGSKEALDTYRQKLEEIEKKYRNSDEDKGKGPNGDIAKVEDEADREKERSEQEIARLREQLARDELSRQRDLMSLDEKRNSLIKERVDLLLAASRAGFDTADGLKKRVEAERTLADIHRVEKEKADEKNKADAAAAKAREEIEKKQLDYMEKFNRVHGHAEEAYLEGLDDKGKQSYLEKKLGMIQATIDRGTAGPNALLDLEDQRMQLAKQLEGLNKQPTRRPGTVSAGDLTRHGGGGIAYFDRGEEAAERTAKAAEKTARTQEDARTILQRIEQNTKDPQWR